MSDTAPPAGGGALRGGADGGGETGAGAAPGDLVPPAQFHTSAATAHATSGVVQRCRLIDQASSEFTMSEVACCRRGLTMNSLTAQTAAAAATSSMNARMMLTANATPGASPTN